MQSALNIRSCSSVNFPRRSLVILSLFFPSKAFSYGIWLFHVLSEKRVENVAKMKFPSFMVSQCGEHSVSLRYFCAAFQRSIFMSPLKLITMKLQSLLPSIIYLLCQLNDFSSAPFFWHQVWQRLGEKSFWYGLQ